MANLKNFPHWCEKQVILRWKEDFEAEHKFLVAMDNRIEEKQGEYGDSWKNMSIPDLMRRLTQNYREWEESSGYAMLQKEKVEIECRKLVDLANLCRFLWERLREGTIL